MEKTYATALTRLVNRGADQKTSAEGLIDHLKREGRMKLLPGILRELRMHQARSQKHAPVLEVASVAEREEAVHAASTVGISAVDAVVNPTLISGWRARSGTKLIDRSGKAALVNIYRNIVTK